MPQAQVVGTEPSRLMLRLARSVPLLNFGHSSQASANLPARDVQVSAVRRRLELAKRRSVRLQSGQTRVSTRQARAWVSWDSHRRRRHSDSSQCLDESIDAPVHFCPALLLKRKEQQRKRGSVNAQSRHTTGTACVLNTGGP